MNRIIKGLDMRLPKNFLGIVLYDGPSLIDGKPILAIANSFKGVDNKKVGEMIKVWIIRKDIDPVIANNIGEDFSVCGTCKHRHFRSCYVNLAHGPQHVYQAYHRERYEEYTPDMLEFFKGRDIRLGSYGDPAAVPIEVWNTICGVASGYTGYTHSWKQCSPQLKKYCMASVETIAETTLAQSRGWRTFRIRLKKDAVLENEFVCPASKEGGVKTSCNKCKGCSGLSSKQSKVPVIIAHGVHWKLIRFIAGIKLFTGKRKYAREYEKVA